MRSHEIVRVITRVRSCYHTGAFVLSRGIARTTAGDRLYHHIPGTYTESFMLSHGIVRIIAWDRSHYHAERIYSIARNRSNCHPGSFLLPVFTRDRSYYNAHTRYFVTPGTQAIAKMPRECARGFVGRPTPVASFHRTGSFVLPVSQSIAKTPRECARGFVERRTPLASFDHTG